MSEMMPPPEPMPPMRIVALRIVYALILRHVYHAHLRHARDAAPPLIDGRRLRFTASLIYADLPIFAVCLRFDV